MKILFLTPRDSKKNLGGVEGHVRILTEELEKRGHKVEEISLDEIDGLNKGPAFLFKGRALGYKFKAWGYLWKKRDLFKWANAIHIHDVFWWMMPFAIMNRLSQLPQYYAYLFPWSPSTRLKSASTGYGRTSDFFQRKKSGPSVFATFHGWEGVCPPTRSAVWQKRLASFLSDGTIGVGSFFEKWYGVRPDRIVWGVVEDKLINRQIDKSTNRQIKNLKIIFLGRMEKVNGMEVVVEALEKLANKQIYKYTNRYTNRQIDKLRQCVHRIIFVGDGNYRKQAEKFGKVTGMVKNPQKYLTAADVVITSSYMSMLEAAAIGKPIIAIANNELKMDYLNCHPLRKWIAVARNAEELTRIIRGLYKGPALREQQGRALRDIENARDWAEKQTSEKLVREYENSWRNVNNYLRS